MEKIKRLVLFKDERFVTMRYTKKVRRSVVYESSYILINMREQKYQKEVIIK